MKNALASINISDSKCVLSVTIWAVVLHKLIITNYEYKLFQNFMQKLFKFYLIYNTYKAN